jgi:hypothetical protein
VRTAACVPRCSGSGSWRWRRSRCPGGGVVPAGHADAEHLRLVSGGEHGENESHLDSDARAETRADVVLAEQDLHREQQPGEGQAQRDSRAPGEPGAALGGTQGSDEARGERYEDPGRFALSCTFGAASTAAQLVVDDWAGSDGIDDGAAGADDVGGEVVLDDGAAEDVLVGADDGAADLGVDALGRTLAGSLVGAL